MLERKAGSRPDPALDESNERSSEGSVRLNWLRGVLMLQSGLASSTSFIKLHAEQTIIDYSAECKH